MEYPPGIQTRAATEVAFAVPPLPRAVADARGRVVAAAERWLSPERAWDLRLVVSEVITNAVCHGGTRDDVRVVAVAKDDYLCVKVTDAGEGIAPRPRATAPAEDGGFGLMLVERLTRRWGMTREGGHTRIWFEFDFDA